MPGRGGGRVSGAELELDLAGGEGLVLHGHGAVAAWCRACVSSYHSCMAAESKVGIRVTCGWDRRADGEGEHL